MAHTLLEQNLEMSGGESFVTFFENVGMAVVPHPDQWESAVWLNNINGIGFIIKKSTGYNWVCCFHSKNSNVQINSISPDYANGNIFYHVSEGESVIYFKTLSNSEKANFTFTYVMAKDTNDEWVVINDNKIYTEYGESGIYNNFYSGNHAEIVNSNEQFMISEACRLDTGVKFKELYFVLSAKSYSDTNCIIEYKGKKYRLVSVSNVKDEAGRYPAFAFPVSD